jgi:hypothetical protein
MRRNCDIKLCSSLTDHSHARVNEVLGYQSGTNYKSYFRNHKFNSRDSYDDDANIQPKKMCYDEHDTVEKFEALGGDMDKVNKAVDDLADQIEALDKEYFAMEREEKNLAYKIHESRREISESLSKFELDGCLDAGSMEEVVKRCQSMHAVLSKLIPMSSETIALASEVRAVQSKLVDNRSKHLYLPSQLKTLERLREELIKTQQGDEKRAIERFREEMIKALQRDEKRVKVQEEEEAQE